MPKPKKEKAVRMPKGRKPYERSPKDARSGPDVTCRRSMFSMLLRLPTPAGELMKSPS
jgi:hypothetical protein